MTKLSLIFILIIIGIGCAQKTIVQEKRVQRFETVAYFTDKQKNKSQQMNLEIVARKNSTMRIDAKVVLGIHIASAVLTQDKIEVALHAEKKFYSGPASQKSLERSLGLPLHPLVLHAMIYRQAMKGAGWTCQSQFGQVLRCEQTQSGLIVTWENQDEALMVNAQSKSFLLQWRILPPETVEERSNYFQLKIPDSYEKLIL